MKISLLSIALAVSLAGSVDAQPSPTGDVNGDGRVDSADLQILADRWLDVSCSAPGCKADLDSVPGVNMADFALLAENWLKDYSNITLVINEFMAKNGGSIQDLHGDYDDWIEIYNYGDDAVDIGRMYLSDSLSAPIGWRVPDNNPAVTTIPSKGYLLIWADDETNEGTLHASFKLSAGGEQVGLFADDGKTLIDGVTFGPQDEDFSYGRLPDGNNNWQVFASSTPGQSNQGAPIEVLISEIMYHPYHPSPGVEDVRQEYIELFNRGTEAVNLSGWRFSDGVDFVFPDITLRGGQYLAVAADVNTFTAKYPGVSNVVGGWNGRLSNRGEVVELVDSAGLVIDRIEYADQGDWAVRELGPEDYYHRGWVWSDEHDGGSKSLELINPAVPNEYGQNWTASATSDGTPGTANSVAHSDIPPLILDVAHVPIIPRPNDAVTVSARIIDELSTGITVALHHRRDGDASFSTLTMFDDGAHGDGDTGDRVYGAELPAQPDDTIVEFYVEASDAGANSRTWPAPSLVDVTPQQVTNALYQVDGSFDPHAGWVPGSQPIYYLIMTTKELAELNDIGDTDLDGRPEFASEAMSNAQMNATFISVDGVDMEMHYNVGVRNRGNRNRHQPPMNYRVNFRRDNSWKGVTTLNLNSKYTHLQLMGSWLFQMAGMAATNATAVQVRVNGQNLAPSDYGRTYGSYVALENYDTDWADNHFPDDGAGNLYRCTYYDDDVQSRTYADLDYKPNMTEYRKNYPKETNQAQDDYSDLLNLIDKLNNRDIPDANFLAEVSQVLNLEQWTRYLATDALIGNREGGLTDGTGDDYAMYRGMDDPRFWLLPHDLDTLLGQGDHDYRPDWSIFNYAGVDGLNRLLNQPDVIKLYYAQYKDLIETTLAPENMYLLVDQLLGDWVSNSEIEGSRGIKRFVAERVNSILYGGNPGSGDDPKIPQEFTIAGPAEVSGYPYTTNDTVDLSGTANAIETRSVRVNGQLVREADWSQRNGTWSIDNIPLNPGINRIVVQAFDGPSGTGNEVDRGYIDVWYDTGSTNDYPKDGGGESLDAGSGRTVRLIVRDSYLPGKPVLVRVEALNDDGSVNRNLWDAVATLSVPDNPGINLSTNQVTLYNGLGSALVSFTGSGDFTLTADINGLQTSKVLIDWSDQPINTVSGSLDNSETWSGVYHIIGGDFTINDGVTLTLSPGTLVLIDGVSSSSNGTDIDVAGSIQSLGTVTSPVTFTAYTPGENWGELHHVNAESSTFQYTNITQAGHSPRVGHSNSGPSIRASNSTFVFEHCSLTDNAGKIGHVTSGCDLTFRNCLFARSIMGPEISGTALLFEDSWITDMHAGDDADGIYIHGQQTGQLCTLTRGVAANMDDDGIDTLGSEVTIEDFIVRDCKDKGISIYGGEVDINYCLIVENNKAPEDPTIATIATKTVNGATAIVNIDHTTIVTSKTAGYLDVGIQSHNKYGVTSGTIIYNVTNSIIDATDPIDVQTPYIESDIHVDYSNIFGEMWPGTGNLNADSMFVDETNHNYRLQETSPCIDAGDPDSDPDPDLTVTDQGYFRFDQGSPNLPEDSLTEDTLWLPGQGPYRITGELTVPFGITLTIMPGTTVFFDPNAKIIIEGQLIAEGTEYELIRFTHIPGADGTWGGIQFVNTMLDNRITFAVIEHGRTNDGMIGLKNSNLLLDHVTLDNTDLRRISTVDSSLIVSNSVFTDIFAPGQPPTTDNRSEHIWGSGVPTDGQFIIENNIFGTTKGHNDAIDIDGPSRPSPIPLIMNNIFMGGGDDALDLESDAHIEGNVFMNYTKDQYNKASGESNVISAGGGKHYVMVRNVFYNVQHIAQIKDDAFATFVNNTASKTSDAAIYFDLGLPARDPGRGAYVDSCIFWNAPLVFEGVIDTTDLTVNCSIIPAEGHHLGVGNIDADPLFVDPNTDFHLKPDSAAIGTGLYGTDMGAYVPNGVAIDGEPDELTYHTEATLIVGGPGITHYKYRLNNGPWSDELSVDVPIQLTSLLNGQSYTVYAIGRNSAGLWQSQDNPTVSRTWTIDTSYSRLVINEVLAHTHGADPDLIELYYDGPASLDLSDMSLTDDPGDTRKFVFSSQTVSSTIMNPGDYLLLYGDLDTQLKDHLGFALYSEGEDLYLYDKPANSGALIDSVKFGPQINGFSIGRIGSDSTWKLNKPTFAQANITQQLGDPETLKINEWLANGEVLFENDFIELFNPHTLPVDLSSLYLTDEPVTQPAKCQLGPLSFIAGQGFAVFIADGQNQLGHVNFRLSADGEIIGLFDAELNEIDKVLYGPQTTDVSQARVPDGTDKFEFLELPTPGITNPSGGTVNITVICLVPEDTDKRVLVPIGDIGQAWRTELDFDDSTWTLCSGSPGGVGYERGSGYEDLITLDVEAQMYNKNTTCYIRIPFTVEAEELDKFTELTLKMRYDDDFVAYLNGVELPGSNFNGTPAWNSRASSNHEADSEDFDVYIDISEFIGNLEPGENILAIQGLNTSLTSSDMLISAELDGTITTSAGDSPFASALELLDGLRVTELMYHATDGSNFDYIELQNISDIVLDLNGVRLSEGIEFTFPEMTLEAGQYVVVVSNLAAFRSAYGTNITVAGEYSGNLSNGGEEIILKLPWPLEAAILRFEYSDRWYPTTDGGGSSLVIYDPLAHPATWDQSESWQPALASPGRS